MPRNLFAHMPRHLPHHLSRQLQSALAIPIALSFAILSGCAGMQSTSSATPGTPSAEAKAELAPTGALRVAVFTGNPLIGSRAKNGEVVGTTVTLGKSLADSLGVLASIIEYATVAKVVDGANTGAWDVAVIGFDASRKNVIDYTPPHLYVDLTYLMASGQAARTAAEADQKGTRIAAARGGVSALYLERTLKHATLVQTESEPASLALLKAGKVQAMAQNRAMLLELAEGIPGSHVIDDRFLAAELAFALPKGRPAALAYVTAFVERAKASGEVQRAVESAKLRGVNVAAAVK